MVENDGLEPPEWQRLPEGPRGGTLTGVGAAVADMGERGQGSA